MQNTSTEFRSIIAESGRTFATKIVINGKTYTNLIGFKISSGTNSSDVITFGDSVSSYLECTIRGVPDTDHLESKQVIAYVGLQLSKSIEWIKMGTFTVTEAKRDDKDVKIHADDNIFKCTKGFFTELKGNQSITTILNEQCAKLGITFVGVADNEAVNVDKLLGMTIREVIGILSGFCGKNAVMDRDGNLKFVWYSDYALQISAASFADPLNVNETDTLINRVRCSVDKDKEINVGTGMGIEFSNPLMTESQLQVIANRVIGFKYRACDLNLDIGRPDIDAGDIIKVIDKRGNAYVVPIMDITFECDGGMWNKIKSKAKTETAKAFESKGPITSMIESTYSELTVTKKLIADTIDAYEGKFESIDTNYLTVNGKLIAVEGEFEILRADNATFKTTVTDKLTAYDADIINLKASYAKIGVMDVDLARINTLLAGTVTSGSTQTIVLNAQNTTIANATIKSAMIDSLSASKITAGIIDASSIHIKSKSGNMDIYDNTISIRDANRVRVQIGKDDSSDYNIYVWDNAGKLMFDATGLKAEGIKDKIIRNDMVSDTANINGSKINITSLVTEINNGTTNIKSSHITYDPTGQSLDVAFNNLKTEVNGDVKALGTLLTVEQGRINALITSDTTIQGDFETIQTNFNSLNVTVNGFSSRISGAETNASGALNKVTSLEANVDGYKITVSNTYATQSTVSGINARVSSTETKLTATSLTTIISSAISGGSVAMNTTKFTMDYSGLHIKNGGFDITNNANEKVMYCDTAGNATFKGIVYATSGWFGKWAVDKTLGTLECTSTTDDSGMLMILNSATTSSKIIGMKLDSAKLQMDTAAGGYLRLRAVHETTASNPDYYVGFDDNGIYCRMYSNSSNRLGVIDTTGSIKASGTIRAGGNLYAGSGSVISNTALSLNSKLLLEWNNGFNIGYGASSNGVVTNIYGSTIYIRNQAQCQSTLNVIGGFTALANAVVKGNLTVNGAVYIGNTNTSIIKTIYNAGHLQIGEMRHYTPTSGNDYLEYATYAGQWYQIKSTWTSDERHKCAIMPTAKKGLDAINKIQHKQFNWIKNGIHRNIGYIAQQLQTIDSQMVDDVGDLLCINADVIIPYITKSVQELSQEITILKSRIATLEMRP